MVIRIFRHFVPISVLLLAVCEVLLISLAWFFIVPEYSRGPGHISDILTSPHLRLALLIGIAMALTGLYHNRVLADYRVMASHIIISIVFLCPITIAGILYWQNALSPGVSLWEIYLKAGLSWLACIAISRAGFLTLADLNLFKKRIIVLGTGEKAARIFRLTASGTGYNFAPMAFLSTLSEPVAVDPAAVRSFDAEPDGIVRCARELRAREIVVATDDRRGLPVHQLLQCRLAGIDVTDYMDFMERETKTVDLNGLQPGWLVFSDGFRGRSLALLLKRCFDVSLSLAVLLFTLPLMLLTALLIVVESPGPALYRQERVGRGGRKFVLLKFRSMRTDAEKDGTPQWAVIRDPRMTTIGAIIRKLRIDELPQLLNVLRGDMSFVGPRPERPEFVNEFVKEIPFYAERHCVKPGITGWAQVNYPYGASPEDARNKLAYDLYYVKNHGLFLDLVIVAQTIRVILWADGAR
jgi:sugar transferase (PEP-CTERM system associated)